ncbi:putative protein [Arabidopsis thaliana]|uniref:TRAF-like superfamily protein n=3 Tax=Arabidopsis TaxID=3701 RepID=Q9M2H4_ARATH|nr:TRAF-like superfamily protein [Arabidopsis thaliana]AEE79779.1 TRAF-like superfamily protein [Arabidopsis thaliana]KAG7628967.1 MATH/TRAF domain [Arabidopsis thaliana x Arabidopsis arenosa]OAP03203.1 hypothetical protein AXX17_AT3G52960 [Arabidopsis thaliana]CAB68180.1 putative protein [Arabidopsis thaliana]|eukprot:NP_191401.1 TRAF-like superfamily protein [Arabidopsis thaliana]
MAKPFDKKFGWVIKDFSSLQSEKCCSVPVLISESKWRLIVFPKGNNSEYFVRFYETKLTRESRQSLAFDEEIFGLVFMTSALTPFCFFFSFLEMARPHRPLSPFFIHSNILVSLSGKTEHCFDGKSTTWGFPAMLSLSKLHEKDGGFLVNGEVMIVAELDVFEVIGTLDESEKSEEASKLVTKKTENLGAESNELLKKTSPPKESNNVKQVENSVKTSPKNKRMWVTFLIIVFFLIGALGKAHEKHLAAKERNFSQNWKVIRPGLEALLSCSCLMLFYYYASLVFSFVCSFFVS